jgi:hypothetical protein
VRNEEECICSVCLFRCNIFIGFRIIKEMPGSVGSGTLCIFVALFCDIDVIMYQSLYKNEELAEIGVGWF